MKRPNSIAATLVAAAISTAQPVGAQPVAAPEGWAPSVARTGTVFFACRAASCGTNATVSYKRLEDGALNALADFQRKNAAVRKRLVDAGQAFDVRNIESAQIAVGGKLRANTQVEALTQPDGRTGYLASAEISDGRLRFSVVSTSPTEATARANLKAFLVMPFVAAIADGHKPPK